MKWNKKDWKIVKVKDIATNLDNRRKPLNQQERQAKQGTKIYPYVGANKIMTYIDEYIFDEKILCVAEDGGSWGSNEKCSFVLNEKCWVNNHAHVLGETDESLLQYLSYYFNYKDLNKYITGTTRGKLTKGALGKIQIPLPPLAVQKEIADLLDTADALRQKTQAQLDALDQLAQSVFLEMFGDPVTNEKGWEVRKLGEMGKVQTGNTPPRKELRYFGNHIEWIKTDNINTPSSFLTEASEFLSIEGETKGRVAKSGSILVTCIAGSKKVIGNSAIANRDVTFNQQINAITPYQANSLFVHYHFIIAQSYVQSFSTNGMKGMINKSAFSSIQFIFPPLALQNQFAAIIKNIEAQKASLKASLQESEDLIGCLLQEVFG